MSALAACRLGRSTLIDNADLSDVQANCNRSTVLGAVRGFWRNEFLFRGFPLAVEWRRVVLQPDEFGQLRYINCEPWVRLTNGTRSVHDGARLADTYDDRTLVDKVAGIVESISNGITLADLILVEDPRSNSMVIVEGNHRATALVKQTRSIVALLGRSPDMYRWQFI
jgi:hypothetical protein